MLRAWLGFSHFKMEKLAVENVENSLRHFDVWVREGDDYSRLMETEDSVRNGRKVFCQKSVSDSLSSPQQSPFVKLLNETFVCGFHARQHQYVTSLFNCS